MPEELELKAVVPDPDVAPRPSSTAAGAVARFRGRMSDRRYDRAGELAARDEVLRVRSYQLSDGRSRDDPRLEGPDPALARWATSDARRSRSPVGRRSRTSCSPRSDTPSSTRWIGTSRSTSRRRGRAARGVSRHGSSGRGRGNARRHRARHPQHRHSPRRLHGRLAGRFRPSVRGARRAAPRRSPARDHGTPSDTLWVVPELGPSLGRLVDPPASRRAGCTSPSTTFGSRS